MESFFYSAATGGFYLVSVHGDNMPDDVVEVSSAEHAALMAGQVFGKVVIPGAGGKPVLADPPPPTLEEAKKMKLAEIAAAFEAAVLKGHPASLGYTMDSGIADLQKLKTAFDFAKLMGDSSMTVVDYHNVAHHGTPLADVEAMLKEVGANYRALYLQKQALRGKVDAAATPEAVAAVAWTV